MEIMRTLYLTCVRSIIEFNCPLVGILDAKERKQLENTQAMILEYMYKRTILSQKEEIEMTTMIAEDNCDENLIPNLDFIEHRISF